MHSLQAELDDYDHKISVLVGKRNSARRCLRWLGRAAWSPDDDAEGDPVFAVDLQELMKISALSTYAPTEQPQGVPPPEVVEDRSTAGRTSSGSGPEDEEEACRELVPEAEWARLLCTLGHKDLPLQVAFLDKSGSMGCDNTTFSALSLAAMNSLHPERGSSLTFFLAGPGETELV